MAVVGVAAVAALGLSGCGGADTAAVVDGDVITVQDAQTAAQQINEAFDLQQPLTTTDAVASLVTAPFIIRAAQKAGHPQTSTAARAAMPKLSDPSQETIDLVRANNAVRTLDQDTQNQILDDIAKADVEINPRFGSFDPQQGMVAEKPNWIAAGSSSATPQTSQSGG